jgi:hypothetical protein
MVKRSKSERDFAEELFDMLLQMLYRIRFALYTVAFRYYFLSQARNLATRLLLTYSFRELG